MRARNATLCLIVAALWGGPGEAQNPAPPPPPAITLPEAVRAALANHDQIAIAESQRTAAEARVTQSKSAYYPRIIPSYQFRHERFDRGGKIGSGSDTRNATGISLTQTIYDSGRREIAVARSEDALRAAGFNTEDARQTVIVNVVTAWFDLRRRKDLVRVAESGAERARATLEATRAFVEAGSLPGKDIYQAQADYENAQVNVIQARNNVLLGETTLRIAMGLAPLTPVEAAETPLPAPAAAEQATRPVSDFVAEAYARRPDLKVIEANLAATRRSVRLARIDAGPQLQSTLTTGVDITPDSGYDGVLLVGLSYPLFDAGASRAAVREARAVLDQAERQRDLARQNIAAEVESAYLLRREAGVRIGVAEAARSAAEVNYTAATESQKEGVGTILDIITAQNQLVTAETSAVQALYDYYTADARLRYAIGNNEDTASGSVAS